MDGTDTSKHLALREGHPPTDQLHMEIRVRVRYPYNPKNYQYHADTPDISTPDVHTGTNIGRAVRGKLDAINEDRLCFDGGDVSIEDMLGIYDRHFVEGDGLPPNKTEFEALHYEFVLVDDSGTVWTELVDVTAPLP